MPLLKFYFEVDPSLDADITQTDAAQTANGDMILSFLGTMAQIFKLPGEAKNFHYGKTKATQNNNSRATYLWAIENVEVGVIDRTVVIEQWFEWFSKSSGMFLRPMVANKAFVNFHKDSFRFSIHQTVNNWLISNLDSAMEKFDSLYNDALDKQLLDDNDLGETLLSLNHRKHARDETGPENTDGSSAPGSFSKKQKAESASSTGIGHGFFEAASSRSQFPSSSSQLPQKTTSSRP